MMESRKKDEINKLYYIFHNIIIVMILLIGVIGKMRKDRIRSERMKMVWTSLLHETPLGPHKNNCGEISSRMPIGRLRNSYVIILKAL